MSTRKITVGALFVALGILIPITFHAAGLGRAFLPMHIPVLLAGFFTGPGVGAVVGAMTPLLSSLFTGMPPMMPPMAQVMIFELSAYGAVTGLLHRRSRLGVYPSLLIAMLVGRVVHGVVAYLIFPLFGLSIPLLYPLTAGLMTGLPGIVVQLVFVPAVVYALSRYDRLAPGGADM